MTAFDKAALRAVVRAQLPAAVASVNAALLGQDLQPLEPVLARVGRNGELPHWYAQLKRKHTLPNLDGKTIGSVVEMLLLAVLETSTLKDAGVGQLQVNPARGVDFPDLDLGIKAPSANYCTSEPYFSAYERLYGNEFDILVLLTDYQEGKTKPPLKLQVTESRYLSKSQVADLTLCRIALRHRDWLVKDDQGRAQRFFRFLAFVNQSDWRAKCLLLLVEHMDDPGRVGELITQSERHFETQNRLRAAKYRDPIADAELAAIQNVGKITPTHVGVIDAADNWVTENLKDAARAPNDNEWNRLLSSPLDGQVGMSFALQWRYNFGRLFNKRGLDATPGDEAGD
jgi:hypothetical protein